MTTSRRPAAPGELTIGTIVRKGNGKVDYKVIATRPVREDGTQTVSVVKVASKVPVNPTRWDWATDFTVEA